MVLFANLRRGCVSLILLNAKCFWMVCCCGGKGINLEGSVLVLWIDDFGQGAGLGGVLYGDYSHSRRKLLE